MGGKVSNLVDVSWGGGVGGTKTSAVIGSGFEAIVKWALDLPGGIDLVVPGPEQPLVDGVELAFRKGGFLFVFPSLVESSTMLFFFFPIVEAFIKLSPQAFDISMTIYIYFIRFRPDQ